MLLSLAGVAKSFGGLMAVRDLALAVDEGEILGLIGPNGSGKTTAFNLITGFIKPDAGKIEFAGRDITRLGPPAVCASGIARTFQMVKPFAYLTAIQNVMVGRLYGHAPASGIKQAREDSYRLLDYVGLAAKQNVLARNLTLVDRKRLELARALGARPKLLLLDELMAGLNPTETEAAMSLIKSIRDSGITIVMVEHIIKAVLGISDRIVVLSAGEKIAEGRPRDVVNDPLVISAYLGKPFHA